MRSAITASGRSGSSTPNSSPPSRANGIARAHLLLQAIAHGAQHSIASSVAMNVVYRFEAVKVEVQQRQPSDASGASGACERLQTRLEPRQG